MDTPIYRFFYKNNFIGIKGWNSAKTQRQIWASDSRNCKENADFKPPLSNKNQAYYLEHLQSENHKKNKNGWGSSHNLLVLIKK